MQLKNCKLNFIQLNFIKMVPIYCEKQSWGPNYLLRTTEDKNKQMLSTSPFFGPRILNDCTPETANKVGKLHCTIISAFSK